MKTAYLFDVDGTLTVSRQEIDPGFAAVFRQFCLKFPTYIVTGSDKPKTVEQIGKDLFDLAIRSYNCSGNDVYEADQNIYTNDWVLPEKPWKYLESKLLYSKFGPKAGWHFEERPGMLNFSIVGRKAIPQQRAQYIEWDQQTNERRIIASEFNELFHADGITAEIGGQTGLDIYPVGCDKSQIIRDFDEYDQVVFFGDSMWEGGNDYSLAEAVRARGGVAHWVEGWTDTEKLLKKLLSD